MILYIDEVDLSNTPFTELWGWTGSHLCIDRDTRIGSQRISTAPLRKHDLKECRLFEERWRGCAPLLMSALNEPGKSCVVWARGPVESDGLLEIMKYIDRWISNGMRYHFPGITSLDGRPGYYDSWIAFEFDLQTFTEINNDAAISFEQVPLSLLFLKNGSLEELIKCPFEAIAMRWVIERNAIAVVHERHYEGCYIGGESNTLRQAVARVRGLLGPTSPSCG
jgi:hypothetical protein